MKKKDKGFRKELIMPIFIVMIMVMSVFGYMWSSSRTKIDYNGYKFYQLDDGRFMLSLEDKRIAFNYYPSELEWINTSKGIGNVFNSQAIFITSDYNSTMSETLAEIKFNLAQQIEEFKGAYAQNSFTEPTEYGHPVITCMNATSSVPVVLIERSDATEIVLENNCLTLRAKNRQEMIRAYERLVYSILGVME